jgi:hypothetical protein
MKQNLGGCAIIPFSSSFCVPCPPPLPTTLHASTGFPRVVPDQGLQNAFLIGSKWPGFLSLIRHKMLNKIPNSPIVWPGEIIPTLFPTHSSKMAVIGTPWHVTTLHTHLQGVPLSGLSGMWPRSTHTRGAAIGTQWHIATPYKQELPPSGSHLRRCCHTRIVLLVECRTILLKTLPHTPHIRVATTRSLHMGKMPHPLEGWCPPPCPISLPPPHKHTSR